MNASAVERALNTRLLGHPLRYLPSVDSTQEIARLAALAREPEGLAVVAGRQAAGKGRSSRWWWSPADGGLYLSLLLRPRLKPEQVPWVTMGLALGAAEAIERICGLRPDVKWPNDLEVRGRKLAGILAEAAFQGDEIDFVIAGLGVNVNVDFAARPDLEPVATSLSAEVGAAIGTTALLRATLERIEYHYLRAQQGTSPQPAWKARLVTLGQAVQARFADGRIVSGVARDVLPDGALAIRQAGGQDEVVRAADVTLREPKT
jgi:BirA family biotin operon repressor/biotin-[acetyl-CoA-carboxylase] ligase